MTQHDTASGIIKQVTQFCDKQQLFRNEMVLVALSGGGDSVALLDMLLELRDEFAIAVAAVHINHGLRGKTGDRDEQFCRMFCESRDVPLTVRRIPQGEIAASKDSIETAARDHRQRILKEIAGQVGASKIATGHTLSDQAETILQRIIRGTGTAGLSGILPIRVSTWIRPLLCLDRAMVREYLSARQLAYCEDETNSDPSFTRNRIRNQLIPLLQEEFSPAVEQSIARLAEINRIQEDWIGTQVDQALYECLNYHGGGKILLDKRVVLGYHTMIQQRLIRQCRMLLEGPGCDDDAQKIEQVRSLFSEQEGKLNISVSLTCEVYRKNIVFTGPAEKYGPCPVTVPGKTVLPDNNGVIETVVTGSHLSGTTDSTITVPMRLMETFGPLNAGSVRDGETMQIPGHCSPIRIRDLFSAASLPTVMRTALPVIRAGAVALWIPGVANSGDITNDPDSTHEMREQITIVYSDGINWQK